MNKPNDRSVSLLKYFKTICPCLAVFISCFGKDYSK